MEFCSSVRSIFDAHCSVNALVDDESALSQLGADQLLYDISDTHSMR
jgi:hypothetical protein